MILFSLLLHKTSLSKSPSLFFVKRFLPSFISVCCKKPKTYFLALQALETMPLHPIPLAITITPLIQAKPPNKIKHQLNNTMLKKYNMLENYYTLREFLLIEDIHV